MVSANRGDARCWDAVSDLNQQQFQRELDPEIESRIAQYEMAYRMQTSVPEVTDLSDEPDATYELYGEDARTPGDVRGELSARAAHGRARCALCPLYHQGWDQHGSLLGGLRNQCRETDQASAALVTDLKRRGMLDDTLVIWGGNLGAPPIAKGRSRPTSSAATTTRDASPLGSQAAASSPAPPTA